MFNHQVFRIGLVLAVAVLLLGVPTQSGAATDSECRDEWSESPADDSCSNESISASGNTDCTISASCNMSSGGQGQKRDDEITVHLGRVDELENCDGWLQVGSCPSGNTQTQWWY